MSEFYEAIRGTQVLIGGVVLQVPPDSPQTDQEVVEREEFITRVLRASAQPSAEAAMARKIVSGVRDGIDAYMRGQIDGETAPLFRAEVKSVAKKVANTPGVESVDFKAAGGKRGTAKRRGAK